MADLSLPDKLRSLGILVIAMIIGITLFSIVAVVLHGSQGPLLAEVKPGRLVRDGFVLLGILWILGVRLSYSKRLDAVGSSELSEGERFNSYRTMLILHLALLELPALLSIVAFLLLGDMLCWLPVVLALFGMLQLFPRTSKLEALMDR